MVVTDRFHCSMTIMMESTLARCMVWILQVYWNCVSDRLQWSPLQADIRQRPPRLQNIDHEVYLLLHIPIKSLVNSNVYLHLCQWLTPLWRRSIMQLIASHCMLQWHIFYLSFTTVATFAVAVMSTVCLPWYALPWKSFLCRVRI